MDFQPASFASVAAFCAVVAGVIVAFLSGVYSAHRSDPARARRFTLRTAAVLAAWLGCLAALVASGRLPSLPLSGLPIFFGPVILVSLAAGLSRFGGALAAGIPIAALATFQAFRLPLELVLHSFAAQGTIPVSMTWSGQNWDIVTGVLALLAGPFAGRSRAVAWLVNLVGLALLLNVMRVAVLSSPVPFGWGVKPPLLLALHLPYAMIGPVCVGGALLGHVILTRALLRRAPGSR